ncbi:MAG: glutamate racemase [Parashewanella sp.]
MPRPILIFDSGIGGLSVFSEIKKKLPNQSYCYLFDNARLPYGELADESLVSGAVNLIATTAKKVQAKLVVVACNTASTLILPKLRATLDVPIVGVVPAIKPAAKLTKTGKIALLATPATINRDYTQELINQYAPNSEVTLIAAPELVMLAEQKLTGNEITADSLVFLKSKLAKNVDVIVLGCTHFPHIKQELMALLPKTVILLDSGEAIAKRVVDLLGNNEIQDEMSHTVALHTSNTINAGLKKTLSEFGFSKIIRSEVYSKSNSIEGAST